VSVTIRSGIRRASSCAIIPPIDIPTTCMGGMIAQELALLIPDRIVTLTLTSTTAGNKREIAPMTGIKMFSKLFFVRDAQSMTRIVTEG